MKRWLAPLALVLLSGCLTTPVPVPPTVVDSDLITIVDQGDDSVVIDGGPGAVDPPDQELRVSYGGEPVDAAIPTVVVTHTQPDGSFSANVFGSTTSRFFIEVLTEDEDLFAVAITGGAGGSAVTTDPGGDEDGDGSPDFIDCAPLDPTLTGQRCF